MAQRAGVSKGTLYLYYPSKEELLKAVIREQRGRTSIAEGVEIVRRTSRARSSELLRPDDAALVARARRRHARPRAIFKLMISEVRNFPEIAEFYVDEVIAAVATSMIAAIVQRGIDSGEFGPVEVRRASCTR